MTTLYHDLQQSVKYIMLNTLCEIYNVKCKMYELA